ncbi:tetratricopeptide repeat protein [uncultured Tenacibaculum sp.]|uniref:tetratricopeptide repeat protein n=1 Tax=uncultured Tenacibaculum sp. TaxID=174713 RepID=UPI00262C4AFA|nr:tetratricopeptide repeat protein [uncultured Tenacibaculum sp.]
MIFRGILLLLLFTSFISNAQASDSTLFIIKKQIDTIVDYNSKVQSIIQKADNLLESDNDRALQYYKYAEEILNKNDIQNKAHIFKKVGIIYRNRGDYDKSMKYAMDAKTLYLDLSDTLKVADALIYIGIVYKAVGDYRASVNTLNESIRLASIYSDSMIIGRSFNMLGGSYRALKKIDSAFYSYKQALAIFTKENDEEKLNEVNSNIAILYGRQKQYEKALKIHLKTLEFLKKRNEKSNMVIAYSIIATEHVMLKDYDKALKYTDSSIALAKQEKFKQKLVGAYRRKSYIYKKKKDFKKAYENHVLYKKYSDSVYTVKKRREIKELELKNEFEIQKKELETAAKRKELKLRLYVLLTVLILFFTFIIGFLLWRDYKARAKRIKDKFEKEKLKKEVLAQKIKVSESELKGLIADNTMRLEFIKQLSKQIKDDKDQTSSDIVKSYANSLLLKLQNQISTENKLTSLQDKINEVNQGFDQVIIERFPNLTKTEREVCSFLRLNLSIKEIASIRNASIDSIKALRYRIRKKMKVPKNQELEYFIQSL